MLEHDRDGSGAAVLAALAKLAAAVAARLVEGGLTIVGVTGSSGKTSTKDLLAAVLSPLGEVIAPPGSFNNELGHPWTVLRATEETDYLVLEMSARHPGNIAALAAIAPPQIAVVLNVGTAHLGEFGSRQAIADTKAELPQAVPASGVVVLNVDDSAVAAMADKTAARVVRVSRCDVRESTCGPKTSVDPSTTWPGHASPCRHGNEAVAGAAGRARRPPGVQRAVRRRRRAGMRGHRRTGRRGAGRGRAGLTAPDGRRHPRRRRDRHQRRLQRQPRLDARRPAGAGLDGPTRDGQRRSAPKLGRAGRDGRARRRHDFRARSHRQARGALRCVSTRRRGNREVYERHASGGGHGGVMGSRGHAGR